MGEDSGSSRFILMGESFPWGNRFHGGILVAVKDSFGWGICNIRLMALLQLFTFSWKNISHIMGLTNTDLECSLSIPYRRLTYVMD